MTTLADPYHTDLIDWMLITTRHDLLDAEDELALGLRIQAGDMEARNLLVRHNLRLAFSIAKRYQHRGVPLADLIQEANIGLMRAADKFDPTRGIRFSTYAMFWCVQAAQRATLDDGHTVRLPVHMGDKVTRCRRADATLHEQLGQAPTDADLAAALGWDVAQVDAVQRAHIRGTVSSLDASVSAESTRTVGEVIADPRDIADAVCHTATVQGMCAEVRHCLGVMTPRLGQVLAWRFGVDGPVCTLNEIGRRLGVTRERVRQIEEEALARLRPLLEALHDGLRAAEVL